MKYIALLIMSTLIFSCQSNQEPSLKKTGKFYEGVNVSYLHLNIWKIEGTEIPVQFTPSGVWIDKENKYEKNEFLGQLYYDKTLCIKSKNEIYKIANNQIGSYKYSVTLTKTNGEVLIISTILIC